MHSNVEFAAALSWETIDNLLALVKTELPFVILPLAGRSHIPKLALCLVNQYFWLLALRSMKSSKRPVISKVSVKVQ